MFGLNLAAIARRCGVPRRSFFLFPDKMRRSAQVPSAQSVQIRVT
jgi:hypothetical protein